MSRDHNKNRGMQVGHDCWVADLEFVDDSYCEKESAIVCSILDRIASEFMATGLESDIPKHEVFYNSARPATLLTNWQSGQVHHFN